MSNSLQVLVNEADGVEHRERDGREYLVAPIKFIKNMYLHKGYVPKDEIVKATDNWDGTPLVEDHPVIGQTPVSVNAESDNDPREFGFIESPETLVNGTAVTRGLGYFDVEKTPDDLVEGLENGKTFAVSSAYGGDELPSGEYDGEERENVKGNLRPDHVAVFTNENNARCSVRDGCMAGELAANQVYVNIGDDGSGPEHDGSDETMGDENPDGEQADEPDSIVLRGKGAISAFKETVTGGAQPANEVDQSPMSDPTEFLVNERGYDEENLPAEDTECFDRLFSNEQKLAELEEQDEDPPSGNEGSGDSGSADSTDEEQDDSEIMERLESIQDSMITADELDERVNEAISANKERSKKEELADEIIANSEEYSEDDKDDLVGTPEKVLTDIHANATQSDADYSAARGARRASASGDPDSFPALSVNERIAESESDD